MNDINAEFEGAAKALGQAKQVVVACHVRPDGDAIGSAMGLALALRSVGKAAVATWAERPFNPPGQYRFLPGLECLVPPDEIPQTPEVFVATDCASSDRLGFLLGRARESGKIINIDHHPGNDKFGEFNIVVQDASSTCELIYSLLQRMGISPDKATATALYTGIVTDTGRFQFSNASARALRIASELREVGVEHRDVAREVYESNSFGYLKLLGGALSRAELVGQVVWTFISRADLAADGVEPEETEGLVDTLRSVREADVAAMLRETSDGAFKVSLRSKGSINVGKLAESMGGGGHVLAAGCLSNRSMEETLHAILAGIEAQR